MIDIKEDLLQRSIHFWIKKQTDRADMQLISKFNKGFRIYL